MNCPLLLTLSLGNLEISEISAAVLITVSLVFLVSFGIVSLKNDSKGMMEWMFDNKANEKRWILLDWSLKQVRNQEDDDKNGINVPNKNLISIGQGF